MRGIPSSIVADILDYDIVVSELALQTQYYVHFQTNTQGKDMDFFIPQPWVNQ